MTERSSNTAVLLHKGWVTLIRKTAYEYDLSTSDFISCLPQNDNIPLQTIKECIKSFYALVKDGRLFYDIAKHITPLTFDTFTLTLWTSPDVKTLLKNMCEYSSFVGAPVRLNYHQTIQGNIELWVLDNEPLNKENYLTFLERSLFISTIIVLIKLICSNHHLSLNIQLIEKNFSDAAIKKYTEQLGVSVQMGYTVRKICIPKEYLYLKISSYDSDIYHFSLNLLRKQVGSINKKDLILQIYNYLNNKDSLADVNGTTLASELNMHVRTLNRKLSEYGTSYRRVLDMYRLEKALYLLENPNVAMIEVAYQLGFSDLSTFSRAFKRWTGVSPTHKKELPSPRFIT